MEVSVDCNTLTNHDRESPDRAIFVTFTEIYFSDCDPGAGVRGCFNYKALCGGAGEAEELTPRSRDAS